MGLGITHTGVRELCALLYSILGMNIIKWYHNRTPLESHLICLRQDKLLSFPHPHRVMLRLRGVVLISLKIKLAGVIRCDWLALPVTAARRRLQLDIEDHSWVMPNMVAVVMRSRGNTNICFQRTHISNKGVCSPTVRIIAFQAIDPGSTPGRRMYL